MHLTNMCNEEIHMISVQSRIDKEGVIFDPLFTDLGSFDKSGGQKIL